MVDKLLFKKLKRDYIFENSFNDFIENNEIEFKSIRGSNIAILYGPNGTGKTSLAKTLDNNNKDINSEFIVRYKEKDYDEKTNSIFHVINDQNNRNIIAGETSDYFIGDNIKRECELKKFIDLEFNKLFKTTIPKILKEKFFVSSGKNELINYISDIDIKTFVKDIVNKQSKGSNIDIKSFIDKIEKMALIDEIDITDKFEEYEYVKRNFVDKKSVIYNIINITDISMNKNVRKIEESETALTILEKFNYLDECVVCENTNIDKDELINRKKSTKDDIIKSMDEKTKSIVNDIIGQVDKGSNDPFKIKHILLESIAVGDIKLILELQKCIKKYFEIFDNEINNLFKKCLDDSDLKEKYKEYIEILKEKPEITDEELLFIKNIVSESIGKEIEFKRDIESGNKFNLFLNGEDILNIDREELHLSNGEQNFISLAFEFLKAKKSKAEIIILDDPISSFDSIYKNKIAFCIVRFLQNKKVLVLTHNTDLIRLLEYQLRNCFNLYLFNNSDEANNGFISVSKKEQKIFLNLDKLLNLFRKDILSEVKNERAYLISMISFMRGYSNIIGDSESYKKLSKVMHGYEKEKIDLIEIYNKLFCDGDCLKELSKIINDSKNIDILETYKSLIDNKESLFSSKCEVTIEDIINLDLKDLEIINKNNYPLLNRTLIHTLNYLILRLKVEKVLIEKYNIEIKENMLLQEIIMSAFKENKDDSKEKIKKKTKDRVFFTSRKTLLNEFNHFEGNMNIFQPAIDITNKALEKERESIIEYLENLEN